MRRVIQLLIVTCTFTLLFSAAAYAADDANKADSQEARVALESKIAELKQQIETLHDQLYDLQRKLAVLDDDPATSPADSDPIIARASQTMPSVIETAEAKPAEADGEAKPEKPFRSGTEIIKRIPVELIPKPDEMTDRFKVQAINEWLASEMVGKEMQVSCKVSGPTVRRKFSTVATKDTQWELLLPLTESAPTRFRTVQVESKYFWPKYNSTMRKHYASIVHYEGDNDFKKVAERVKDGHSAKIKGVIKVIELRPNNALETNWSLSISLEELTVDVDQLRKYSNTLVKD